MLRVPGLCSGAEEKHRVDFKGLLKLFDSFPERSRYFGYPVDDLLAIIHEMLIGKN